jgi:hypothetical protein
MGNLFPAAFGNVSALVPSSTATQATSAASPSSSASAGLVTTATSSTQLPSPTAQSSNVAAIAGGAAGGAFGGCLLLLIIVFAILKCRRRKRELALAHPAAGDLSNPQSDSKGHDTEGTVYNDGTHSCSHLRDLAESVETEAYYPGRPIFGVPNAVKYHAVTPELTPGPPAYQSPQRSPNRNTHEIDSNAVYEVEGGREFERQGMNADGRVEEGAVRGLGLDYIAELPNSSKTIHR